MTLPKTIQYISRISRMPSEEESPKCNPFGTRYLVDEEKVWEHNAWDNVEWDDEMRQRAYEIVENQKNHKVDDTKAKELTDVPHQQWDAFYSQHSNNFFKDRNWLLKEFPELDMNESSSPTRVLEVGCGVGNTSLPLLQWDTHQKMFIYASDYSSVAVDNLKKNELFDPSRMEAFQWDITQETPPEAPSSGSIDFIICIYVLSAIHPSKNHNVINRLTSLLKPGGMILFKDYGRYDLTQLRFKKDRLIEDNLYCRGDGTLVYFYSLEQLDDLMTGNGLEKKLLTMDKRLIVNRAKQVKMYRQWIQAKYRKPL